MVCDFEYGCPARIHQSSDPEREQCNEQAPHSQSKVTWTDLCCSKGFDFLCVSMPRSGAHL